jgi:thiosulfate dehydrogenase (quinone) large subunit
MDRNIAKGLVVLRVVLGWGFLYAGLSKVIDFAGSGQPFSAGGFLQHATAGTWPGAAQGAVVNPTNGLWVAIGQNAGLVGIINFLVVFGEITIGLALILGLVTRFAGIMGAVMMALFYLASWDFAHGFVNEQLMYGVSAGLLAVASAGRVWGLDAVIEKSAIVRRAPGLRYVVGLLT